MNTRAITKNKKVVTFGEVMLRLTTPNFQRFSQTNEFIATYGGSEANVAISLVNFGISTEFVTRLPENAMAQACVNSLQAYGLGTDGIIYGGKRMGLYFLESGAAFRNSNVVYDREGSSFATLRPGMIDWEKILSDAGWFQSSLLTAVGAFGQGAPFKECVTHGWTVDGEGKAMHKSLGNGVDPADVFNENGADILRLWAASADYHADVRCSKEIFKQLSQNYLKFRNTCKFMLDNLVDFDPENLVKPEEMPVLDRWLLTKLNELIEKAEQSYCDYEFHIITHAVNDFCVNTLSSFYLDIVKDRLYCEGAESATRRSAQTALYLTLHTLSKLFAPILAFTCDEIWLAMPHTGDDDARNVVLNEMNKPFTAYALTAEEMANWEKLAEVRTVVNGVLEAARAEKKIGKSLEADVHLTVPAEDAFLANVDGKELADLLIVSQVEVTVGDSVKASAEEAAGTKCPRCWKHSTAANAEGLCPRCAEVMRSFPDLA